jgi:phosphatidylinositol alpha-1,6-mannosyltransferase
MEILPGNLRGFRREAYREILQGACLVHAISRYTRDLIIEVLEIEPDKIRLINPPVKCNLRTSRRSCPGPGTVIGTLTRLQRRKNVPNIIRALEILNRNGDTEITYHLAGAGPDQKSILSQLKKVSFRWKYFGAISEEFKGTRLYPELYLFVMPPLDLPNQVEGFGIVYLEANAYGIPVIASRTGGVEDAVCAGVSGEFADPEQPQDIARVIHEVLQQRRRYSSPARRWVQRFELSVVGRQFAQLYREAVGGMD